MVLLNAVIQDGHHDALARVSLFPGLTHVQVPLVCVVLPREALALGDTPSHGHCDGCVPKTHPALTPLFCGLQRGTPGTWAQGWAQLAEKSCSESETEPQTMLESHRHSTLCRDQACTQAPGSRKRHGPTPGPGKGLYPLVQPWAPPSPPSTPARSHSSVSRASSLQCSHHIVPGGYPRLCPSSPSPFCQPSSHCLTAVPRLPRLRPQTRTRNHEHMPLPHPTLTRYHCCGNLGSVGSMKTSRLVLRFATCCSSHCT